MSGEAVVSPQKYGLQPELSLEVVPRDVDVRRLIVFPAVEMEAVRTDAQDRGHSGGKSVGGGTLRAQLLVIEEVFQPPITSD